MTPERIPHKKISHGEAIHRRRILADIRQKAVFDVDKPILDRDEANRRLAEINQYLSPEDQTLSIMESQQREETRTELEIERSWLQSKLGLISSADRQRSISGILNELQINKSIVYERLVDNEHGLSMLEKIRNKVYPPTLVAGYHTKQ